MLLPTHRSVTVFLRARRVAALAVLALASVGFAHAQNNCTASGLAWVPDASSPESYVQCGSTGLVCRQPEVHSVALDVAAGCDATVTSCGATAIVAVEFPGNNLNPTAGDIYSAARVRLLNAAGSEISQCGYSGAPIKTDDGVATATVAVACGDPSSLRHTLELDACPCAPTGCPPSWGACPKTTSVAIDFSAAAGCVEEPPQDDCEQCPGCPAGGPSGIGSSGAGGRSPGKKGSATDGGGFRVTGKGVSITPGDSGPGAMLTYFAGGVGHPGFPGTAAWNAALGRYWSHDFAERIVVDTVNPDKVWLLTRIGNFRSFTDGNGDGLYEGATPSNEYRKLVKTAGEYELRYLDGTTAFFDLQGRWQRNVDRNGNALVGSYNGSGQLVSAELPRWSPRGSDVSPERQAGVDHRGGSRWGLDAHLELHLGGR